MYLCILKLQNKGKKQNQAGGAGGGLGGGRKKKSPKTLFGIHGVLCRHPWSCVLEVFFFFPAQLLGFLHLTVVSASVLVVLLPVGKAVLVMYAVAVSEGCGAVGQDGTGLAFLSRLFGTLGKPLALHVGLVPEVGEEDEEEGAIHPDEVEDHRHLIVTAGHEVILCSVKGHQHKLHLEGSRIRSGTVRELKTLEGDRSLYF